MTSTVFSMASSVASSGVAPVSSQGSVFRGVSRLFKTVWAVSLPVYIISALGMLVLAGVYIWWASSDNVDKQQQEQRKNYLLITAGVVIMILIMAFLFKKLADDYIWDQKWKAIEENAVSSAFFQKYFKDLGFDEKTKSLINSSPSAAGSIIDSIVPDGAGGIWQNAKIGLSRALVEWIKSNMTNPGK